MPAKRDDSGKHWVEMNLVVQASLEDAWRAIATGPGYSAWFTKTTVEERVGGVLRFDFGAGASTGEVTTWDPPHRLEYVERDWMEGAPPVATEITLEERPDGRCLIRMVHSLDSATDDWDGQLESFENGWPGFFEILRIYLAHFAGQPAATQPLMTTVEGDLPAAWRTLVTVLGLAGAHVGDRVATQAGPEPLSGVVERIQQDANLRSILVRLESPGPGVAAVGACRFGTSTMLALTLYRYGEDAAHRAAANQGAWKQWFDDTLASHAPA